MVCDYSYDDSVADPSCSPAFSFLTQHEKIETTLHDASIDIKIPKFTADSSLLQQNKSMSCRKRKQDSRISRNLGLSYVTASGKIIDRRQMKELPNCRNKCRHNITDEQRAAIHKELWNLGSYDLRRAFISSLITIQEKKRQRRRVEDPSKQRNRQCTYKYHFNVNTKKIFVCQGCFIKTLSISDTMVKSICLKKRFSSAGIKK